MKRKDNLTEITVVVSMATADGIEEAAKRDNRPASHIVDLALREYLKSRAL